MAFDALTAIDYWNASTNDRGLVPGRALYRGAAYVVSVGGTTDLGQAGDWEAGDIAAFVIDRWVRIPSSLPFVPLARKRAPFDPYLPRPTAGGIGLASIVSDLLYSHFPQLELGQRGRLHCVFYMGEEHGQAASERVCLAQVALAGVPMDINGTGAVGGVAPIASRTRAILESARDLSAYLFLVRGYDANGNPISEVIQGPNKGRRTGTTWFYGAIYEVLCNGDCPGAVTVGFWVTQGSIMYARSDDNGRTWETRAILDSFANPSVRGYRPGLLVSRTGTVVIFLYKMQIEPEIALSNVRFVSRDNGETWSGELPVAFSGLEDGDDMIVWHSRWRQLGSDEGGEDDAPGKHVSVGALGNRSYFLRTEDEGALVQCAKFAEVNHAADNTLSWDIESIDDGTNTVVLEASHGDVRAWWPNGMSSLVVDAGDADGDSYVISTSYSGGKTRIVLNELAAGVLGANARLRRLYGPRQVLAVDLVENTISIEGDQTVEIKTASGNYVGFNGFSSAGVGYLDGLMSGAVEVEFDGNVPGLTTVKLSQPIPDGTIARPTSRLSDVQLGEYGIGLLTDRDMTIVPRANAMPSALPRFVTSNGGENFTLVGATSIVEGSYVAIEVDFVPGVGGMVELITAFARGDVDSYFGLSCNALLARDSSEFFSPPWYFLPMPGSVNSGYHALVFPRGDAVAIGLFGRETGESTSQVEAWTFDFAPLTTGVVYANRAPTAGDDETKGHRPFSRWARRDGSGIYLAKSTAEGAAVWTQLQTVIPGGNSWALKLTADQSLTTGVTADVLWDADLGTSHGGVRGNITYDSATGWITVPDGGYLTVNGMVRVRPTAVTSAVIEVQVDLDTDSTQPDTLQRYTPSGTGTQDVRFGISVLYIEPGGRVRIRVSVSGSGGTPTIDHERSYFTGKVED